MNIERILHGKIGKIFMSVLLGLGLATLFRKVCKNRDCIVFYAPDIGKIKNQVFKFEDFKNHFLNVAGDTVPAALIIAINSSASMEESTVQPALKSFIDWYKLWSATISGTEGCVHFVPTQSERWMKASLDVLKSGAEICGLKKAFGDSSPSGDNLNALSVKLDNGVSVLIDPLVHSGSSNNGKEILLSAGEYLVIIDESIAVMDGFYNSNIKIRHVKDEQIKYSQFLHKGKFKTKEESKEAYEGLSLTFQHDGGMVSFYNSLI